MWRIMVVMVVVAVAVGTGVRPAAAQQQCVSIGLFDGWGPYSVSVPSWATQLRFDVAWSGLQLRVFLDNVVYATDMYGDGSVRQVWTGVEDTGWWAGSRQIEMGGIMIDMIGDWRVYACGSPPPTPTPIPTPTPRPPSTGPGCITRIEERGVWVGEGGVESLTLYGPTSGWWIVQVSEDNGASGAQYVGWRAVTSSGMVLAERIGDGQFEVRSGMTVTISAFRTPLTGPGMVGVGVTVVADCSGLVATPLVPADEDIREVEFGVETVGERFCPIVLNRVVFSVAIPFWQTLELEYPGVAICFGPKALLLRWGDFNVVDWLIPLLALGFVWNAWLALRRG